MTRKKKPAAVMPTETDEAPPSAPIVITNADGNPVTSAEAQEFFDKANTFPAAAVVDNAMFGPKPSSIDDVEHAAEAPPESQPMFEVGSTLRVTAIGLIHPESKLQHRNPLFRLDLTGPWYSDAHGFHDLINDLEPLFNGTSGRPYEEFVALTKHGLLQPEVDRRRAITGELEADDGFGDMERWTEDSDSEVDDETVETDTTLANFKRVAATVRTAKADGWLDGYQAGRNAALAIAIDEAGSESARENGQAWVNCANQIADLIKAMEP